MSTVARLGAMLAPFVPLLGLYYEPLPLLLFGTVSFFGGLLALLLPETLGRKLPNTVSLISKKLIKFIFHLINIIGSRGRKINKKQRDNNE